MNLLISLRSEILKTRRTASFYFTLIGAAVVPVLFLFIVLTDGMRETRKDPLNAVFKIESEMNGLAFFPWFIVLICTLLPQIEYKNNTWKQVFASPQTKANVFLARFLNIQLLLLLFLVATHLFMFLAVGAAHFIDPSLQLLNHSFNGQVVLLNAANAYVMMSAVCAIQFWIGLRFRNFIVPIAVGLALWLTGTVLVLEYKSSLANYFPYSFQTYPLTPGLKPKLEQVAWTSVGYAVVFLAVGFLDFRQREITK
jgi:hypothetical protein